jgi:hypothetical protein
MGETAAAAACGHREDSDRRRPPLPPLQTEKRRRNFVSFKSLYKVGRATGKMNSGPHVPVFSLRDHVLKSKDEGMARVSYLDREIIVRVVYFVHRSLVLTARVV